MTENILKKAVEKHALTQGEILALLRLKNPAPLFKAADRARAKYKGPDVHLRGLIEFSNICARNCRYCGIRRDNKKVKRYCMDADTVIKTAAAAKAQGFKTVVLQSGEYNQPEEEILQIIKGVKKLGLIMTLSLGEKSRTQYAAYKKAGADRYLLRVETTDAKLYKKLHPGMSLAARKRCLRDIKALGFEVGTGILTGLPGQTLESIAKDILFIKRLPADMVGLGPFIPAPGTPLARAKGGSLELSLKVIAIIRLLLPHANIPATTAMEALQKNGRNAALQAGANVIMPNVTEEKSKKDYNLYPGKPSLKIPSGTAFLSAKKQLAKIKRQAV